MKLKLSKNWIAKILCLLLATGIWFLINNNFVKSLKNEAGNLPPKATPVDERTLQPKK